jgi:hypothetical protein
VLLSTAELPSMWGLVEIGTGAPRVVVEATLRPEAEPLRDGFMQSLLRAAGRALDLQEEPAAPLAIINRPALSRTTVGLACGHVALRPHTKVLPRALPCLSCAAGLPTDPALVDALVVESTDDDLRLHARKFAAELRRRGLDPWEPEEGWGEPNEIDAAAEMPYQEEP